MEPRTLQFIAGNSGGKVENGFPGLTVTGVCTDSRSLKPGDLFIPLEGERFDGHEFLSQVLVKGAGAALISAPKQNRAPAGLPLVVVDNTRKALAAIASAYRKQFSLWPIAVCGSNGKTTTKDLIASVLSVGFPTLKSQASFNNDIGVPLTLLNIETSHRAGVFEAGTNHPGELRPLIGMIQPLFGVITSIGREHLEHFGDINGVIAEESVLAELLPANGKLFLNGDAPEFEALVCRARASVIKIGRGPRNDWRILSLDIRRDGTEFSLQSPEEAFNGNYKINLCGPHQVTNAVYAIAIGRELGLARSQVQRGLDQAQPAKMRLEVKTIDGFTLLDDCYNANADSMAAALDTLHQFPCRGSRIAVLGDMAELGETTLAAHAEIGRRAAELGVDCLIAVGQLSGTVGAAARTAGLKKVFEMREAVEAGERLGNLIRPGDVALVKASRSSRLERVVKMIQEQFQNESMPGYLCKK